MTVKFLEFEVTIDVGEDPIKAQELAKIWNASTNVFAYMQSLGVTFERVDLIALMLFARAKAIESDELPVDVAWLNLIASNDHKNAFKAAFETQRLFLQLLEEDRRKNERPPPITH